MPEIIIDDSNFQQHLDPARCGTTPRDWSQYPHGSLMHAKPFDLPLIPESEWESRLQARIAAKAQLSDVRNTGMFGQPIPARDQGQRGYCWAHSGVSAHLVARAAAGLPYVDLSAYAIACIIKRYADEGGWGSEGIEFQSTRGCPTSEFWPQQSVNPKNDNPQTWENAALHKYIEWRDLDPNNMKAQMVTCLLLGIPLVTDMDWWSHSIATIDLVSLNPFRTRILNSWGDSWSENGTGLLEGSKAIASSAWACILTTASPG